jgi:hypothetical protein
VSEKSTWHNVDYADQSPKWHGIALFLVGNAVLACEIAPEQYDRSDSC